MMKKKLAAIFHNEEIKLIKVVIKDTDCRVPRKEMVDMHLGLKGLKILTLEEIM